MFERDIGAILEETIRRESMLLRIWLSVVHGARDKTQLMAVNFHAKCGAVGPVKCLCACVDVYIVLRGCSLFLEPCAALSMVATLNVVAGQSSGLAGHRPVFWAHVLVQSVHGGEFTASVKISKPDLCLCFDSIIML